MENKSQPERKKASTSFYLDEFNCPCCGKNEMKQWVIDNLQSVRDAFRAPLRISSGFRCADHNAKVGGTPTSDHLKGMAVDILCTDGPTRRILVSLGLRFFETVGVKKDCLHFAVSMPPRVFTYD